MSGRSLYSRERGGKSRRDDHVENLWTQRAKLVENLRAQIFFRHAIARSVRVSRDVKPPSRRASLDLLPAFRKINLRSFFPDRHNST